jgi:hypothetical protein
MQIPCTETGTVTEMTCDCKFLNKYERINASSFLEYRLVQYNMLVKTFVLFRCEMN